MRVHRYSAQVYEGLIALTHGRGQRQERLYVPNCAVIGFRDKEEMDFFSDDKESIEKAEKHISVKSKDIEYIGEIELPDEIVNKLLLTGKSLQKAKRDFDDSAKKLMDLI
jgi:hypothetical protein